MANRAEYVKTGNSTITGLTNKLSVIPVIGFLTTPLLGAMSVLWDSGKWLARGKVGSAATELATGVLAHGLNFGASTGVVWWAGQAVTTGASGHTIGTHGRAAAEAIIGGVTGALGIKPQVLKSYPAGIGSMPGASSYYAQAEGPGYWTTRAAQQQGVDAQQRYAQYRNGEGREHVDALRNAAMGGQQYRGA